MGQRQARLWTWCQEASGLRGWGGGPGTPDDSAVASVAEKVAVQLAQSAGARPQFSEPPEGSWGWLVLLAAM